MAFGTQRTVLKLKKYCMVLRHRLRTSFASEKVELVSFKYQEDIDLYVDGTLSLHQNKSFFEEVMARLRQQNPEIEFVHRVE